MSTVRTWANSGKLEGAFRLNGRDWRVPASTLKKYLAGQQQKTEDLPENPSASRLLSRSNARPASRKLCQASKGCRVAASSGASWACSSPLPASTASIRR